MMFRVLILSLLALVLVACAESTPSDISGCVVEEGQSAEDAYSEDFGCANETVLYRYAPGADDEDGHGDEDAEHSDDEGESGDEDDESESGQDE